MQVARDQDLRRMRMNIGEDFTKWDEVLKVKVKKKAAAEELVRDGERVPLVVRFTRPRLKLCLSLMSWLACS